jgi:hypothetical protein
MRRRHPVESATTAQGRWSENLMSQNDPDFLDDMTHAGEAATPAQPDTADTATVEKGDEPNPDAEAAATAAQDAEKAKSAAATPAVGKSEMVPVAGLMAERHKRQESERKVRELEAKLTAQQTPPPDFFGDPAEYVKQAMQQAETQANKRLVAALEAQARDSYPDYDEVLDFLNEQAASNPALAQQVFDSANPAVAAYKLGKQLREMDRMKDPDAYRAQLEAELRAKWEAEQQASANTRQRVAAEIPPDLAAARSATGDAPARGGAVFDTLFKG